MPDIRIEPSWKHALAAEFDAAYFKTLSDTVRQEYLSKQVFPPPKDVFRAFDECPFDQVRVVILGQDPYHNDRQAHGLCFSVRSPEPAPPSLVNIYKEMKSDVGGEVPKNGDLTYLARQGVLLLNAMLTVVAHSPASHRGLGWEQFTDAAIKAISDQRDHVVFLLWGSFARSKAALVDQTKHLVLQAPHPSPLSAYTGFFGSKHFSKANQWLAERGEPQVEWLPRP